MADLAGQHLIDGDAGTNVGGAFVETHAGEQGAVAAGVVAAAVGPRIGGMVVDLAEDLQLALVAFQGS